MAKRPPVKTSFKPGQSGNPKGKPKGTRDTLSRQLIQDFYDVWIVSGKKAVEDLAKDDPATFVRVAASMVPKQAQVTHTVIEQVQSMTDEQLTNRIRQLNGAAGTLSANDGTAETPKSKKAL